MYSDSGCSTTTGIPSDHLYLNFKAYDVDEAEEICVEYKYIPIDYGDTLSKGRFAYPQCCECKYPGPAIFGSSYVN